MVKNNSLTCTKKDIIAILEQVKDPEIPVLSVIDLGIIRDIIMPVNSSDILKITYSPTYMGCPANDVIENDIMQIFKTHNITHITLEKILHPPWSTTLITEEGRAKLLEYGIVPPVESKSKYNLKNISISCPLCKSKNTILVSYFGSTSCKSLYKCKACYEPFEYFKCM